MTTSSLNPTGNNHTACPTTPDDLVHATAFNHVKNGNLGSLKAMIDSKQVPILVRNEKGHNLLHQAVLSQKGEIIIWLGLEQDTGMADILFCQQSIDGLTPIEVAIGSEQEQIVNLMIRVAYHNLSNSADSLAVLQLLLKVSKSDLVDENSVKIIRLKTVQVEMLALELAFFDDEPLSKIKERIASSKLLFQSNYFDLETMIYAMFLHSVVEKGKIDVCEWALDHFNVPLIPPSKFEWGGRSLADSAALGALAGKFISEYDTPEEKSLLLSPRGRYHESLFFHWDGKANNLLYSIKRGARGRREDEAETDCSLFLAVSQKGWQKNLKMTQFLVKRYDAYGAFSIPQLDILIIGGQLEILKWLVAEGYVDLNASIAQTPQSSHINAPEKESNLAICKHPSCQGHHCPSELAHSNEPYQCIEERSIAESLRESLAKTAPWLNIDKEMTIADALFGVACGSGSIMCLEWLVDEIKVDPSGLYFGSSNGMHIGAARGMISTCKWLACNGFIDMCRVENDSGHTPVHEAILSLTPTASLVFKYFETNHLLDVDWVVHAPNSIHSKVKSALKQFRAKELVGSLDLSAPLGAIINFFREIHLGDVGTSEIAKSFIKRLVVADRPDVLLHLFSQYFFKKSFRFSTADLTSYGVQEAQKLEMIELVSFFESMMVIHDKIKKLSDVTCEFGELVISGGAISELNDMIRRHNNIRTSIPTDFQSDSLILSCTTMIEFENGCNSIETAIENNHLHIFKGFFDGSLHMELTVKALTSICNLNDCDISFVKLIYDWLAIRQLSFDFKASCYDHLRSMVRLYQRELYRDDVQPAKEMTRILIVIKFIASYPGVDINLIDADGNPLLFYLTRRYSTKRDPKLLSKSVLHLVKLLVGKGLDLSLTDKKNKTFVELAVAGGTSVLLNTIRWIALEKNVGIQFQKFGTDPVMEDEDIATLTREFEAIQIRQRENQISDRQNDILASVRQQTSSAGVPLQALTMEANRLLKSGAFVPASRLFTLAIDKSTADSPLRSLEHRMQLDLVDLFFSRATCYTEEATKRRSMEVVDRAMNDCQYLMDISMIITIPAHTLQDIKRLKDRVDALKGLIATLPRPRTQQSRGKKSKKGKGSYKTEKNPELRVISCGDLVKSNMASNATCSEDSCPICQTEWDNYPDLSFAAVLTCSHAVCASCLSRYKKGCEEAIDEDDPSSKTLLSCSLCRVNIPPQIVGRIALDIISDGLIDSFNLLAEQFAIAENNEIQKMFATLLLEHDFDLLKVEGILFNILGCINSETTKDLTSEEKRDIYNTSRAPVIKLEQEYRALKEYISSIWHTETKEWKDASRKMMAVSKRLREARNNACRDIFERTNVVGQMGSITDQRGVHIDLHGLHVEEAKRIVTEFAVPVIPVVKNIVLITGRGLHSENGSSVLKSSMIEFWTNLGFLCEELKGNQGALRISQNSSHSTISR